MSTTRICTYIFFRLMMSDYDGNPFFPLHFFLAHDEWLSVRGHASMNHNIDPNLSRIETTDLWCLDPSEV